MKVAVAYENGEIFPHFGRTKQFKLYDVEDGKVIAGQIADAGESGHGALAGFLKDAGADAVICGGIGAGARTALAEAGVRLYPGVTGPADAAAKAFAEGKLHYVPDAHCDRREHDAHGHDCHFHAHDCHHEP